MTILRIIGTAYADIVQHHHLCNGKCPDTDDDAIRDPDCLACEFHDLASKVQELVAAVKEPGKEALRQIREAQACAADLARRLETAERERDEARRDWQMYVHEVSDETARADGAEAEVAALRDTVFLFGESLDNAKSDAAEMVSECGKAKMRVMSLEAELSGLSDPDANRVGKHQRPGAAADTQRLSALQVYPRSGTARRKVLDYIARWGAGGATDDEIQFGCSMNPSTERPRRVELVEGGWVEDSGTRRPTLSGSPAVVWILTERGRAAL